MAGLDGSIQGQFALDVQGLDRLKHSAARDPQKQLRSAAEQFEALFLHRMIKSMRDASPRSELTDSSQMRFYQSLFDQQMSQHMAGRGLGLADQLVAQLSGKGTSADAARAASGTSPLDAIPRGEPRRLPGVEILQRIGRGEHRAHLAAFDVADQILENMRRQNRRSGERQIVEIHRPQIELHDRPRDCA